MCGSVGKKEGEIMRTPYFRILIFKILPQIRQNFNRVKRFLRKKNQKVCFFQLLFLQNIF